MTRLCWTLLVLSATLLSSCAAVRGRIVAETAFYPVSLSPYLYDDDQRKLSLNDGLDQVGTFTTDESFVAAFYGFLPTWWTWDASDFLNEVVKRYGGEGIVELKATVSEISGLQTLYAWFTQTTPLAPIWMSVRLSGKVVRRH